MHEDDARKALEKMYRTSRNWRTSVREKLIRFRVQAAQSSLMEEQLETLRNNVNAQINILKGKSIQNVSYSCEFCQGPYYRSDCARGGILLIFEDMEQVDTANVAPIRKFL